MTPWILRKPQTVFYSRRKIPKDQNAKTLTTIEMIQAFRKWLAEGNISDKQIVVIADSWYSNQIIQTFINQTTMNFRLDTRSNLNVQCPNHQAIISRGKRCQGRKRHNYVYYVPLKQFLGNSHQWHYFTDLPSGARAVYNKVITTLKTAERVTISAFQRESLDHPKLILIWAFRLQPVDPRTVYSQYQARWCIEETHRDLKHRFGLSKCQAQPAWIFSDLLA